MLDLVKRVYDFEEGNKEMRKILGGKGANLAEMTSLGINVPPGFTITTETCIDFFEAGGELPEGLWDEVLEHVKRLEIKTGKKFGDPNNPLLVSVRSGAPVSMPGMMDTVLNLGINDKVVNSLIKLTDDERFVYDAYRRFITMFSDVVMHQDRLNFEQILEEVKEEEKVELDPDISVEGLKKIVKRQKQLYRDLLSETFPTDPLTQLKKAIIAVFNSWNIPRAINYRKFEGILDDMGTACNIQTMVYGNMGWNSGSGVMFTRNPADGDKGIFGELLFNAQGEDVVAGTRTPMNLKELNKEQPELFTELIGIAERLEHHYSDMQDLEFTIENSELFILQTRTGKRTARAAIKIAVDMVEEELISKNTAIERVTSEQVERLLHPQFDPEALEEAEISGNLLTIGLNASPGAASGKAIFDANTAEQLGKAGENVIMVRPETQPDDVHGMVVSQGFITQHGGGTSHAAVVARGWGKPCVAGAEEIRINIQERLFTIGNHVIKEGDYLSIDGATGRIFSGIISKVDANLEEEKELNQLLIWADEVRQLGVWTNADNPEDALKARTFGAEGIGLARTEHMFFDQEGEKISRRDMIVKMILRSDEAAPLLREEQILEKRRLTNPSDQKIEAELENLKQRVESSDSVKEYNEALQSLLPYQRQDFEGIFKVMDGLPVIIRLIDPPMHEFLPPREQLIEEVTKLRHTEKNSEELRNLEKILNVVESLWETNPMLGLRGCRAGLMYPGLTEMQVRAIFEAACNVTLKEVRVHPEIMIPLTSHVNEFNSEREKLEEVARKVMEEKGLVIKYKIGTMIEIPRAALTADEIAENADFFSFGTNDLTQMTFGISRDDAEGKFLLNFIERGLLPSNPFQQLDREGVGQLMEICVNKARKTKKDIEIGICGEHGGDPLSIEFCHMIGLNYVSASPYRIPIARLSSAQARLKHGCE